MAESAHLERRLATAFAIVFFLSGIVFPFGSTSTGEYKATAVNSGVR